MSSVTQQNTLTSTSQLTHTVWNTEMSNLYTGLTNIGTSQLASGAVTLAKLASAANPGKRESDHGLTSYVANNPDSNSWRYASASTLSDAKLGAGIAYVLQTSTDTLVRIDRSSGPIPVPTLTASSTNYVFLKADNTLRVSTSATAATDEMVITSLTTDGTTVTSSSFLAATSPFANNLPKGYMVGRLIVPGTTPASQVTIKAPLVLRDSTNAYDISITTNITDVDLDGGTGAGKLDTGSPATSTPYYLWVIADSNGANNPSAVWSASISAPTLPATHDIYRCIGARYNNGSGNLVEVQTVGEWNYLQDPDTDAVALSNGTATSSTEVNCGTALGIAAWFDALYANEVELSIVNTAGDSGADLYIASGLGTAPTASIYKHHWRWSGQDTLIARLMTGGTNDACIRYLTANGTPSWDFSVSGWKDNLGRLP